jgi:hypothetical protein
MKWNIADMKKESMWDLHWILEQWDRFFFEHFSFFNVSIIPPVLLAYTRLLIGHG